MNLCLCGCGRKVTAGRRFVNGHNKKGTIASEETKEKIRQSMKGKQNAKGCIRSEETRKRMSEAQTGRKHTEKSKKKMSEASLGKFHSTESRRKMSMQRKGRSNSQFILGTSFLLDRHRTFKKQECIFGCESKYYDLHHEPPIENILTWEGRLVNLCVSCHQRIHRGSLELPKDVGTKWTIGQTEELLRN